MEDCNILECNLHEAINIIKGRWTMFILYELESEPRNFSYLQTKFLFLTNSQLSRSLKALLEFDLIEKQEQNYCIKQKGLTLIPILDELEAWFTNNYGSIE